MNAVLDNNFTDYKVADISLADWGFSADELAKLREGKAIA